jgi:hypothetical protein
MDKQAKPSWLDLERIIPLTSRTADETAERLTSLSADTIKRLFPNKVRKLSPRRYGMKLRDALAINDGMK